MPIVFNLRRDFLYFNAEINPCSILLSITPGWSMIYLELVFVQKPRETVVKESSKFKGGCTFKREAEFFFELESQQRITVRACFFFLTTVPPNDRFRTLTHLLVVSLTSHNMYCLCVKNTINHIVRDL